MPRKTIEYPVASTPLIPPLLDSHAVHSRRANAKFYRCGAPAEHPGAGGEKAEGGEVQEGRGKTFGAIWCPPPLLPLRTRQTSTWPTRLSFDPSREAATAPVENRPITPFVPPNS